MGRPWTADGFRSSWGKLSDCAGIGDLTFHDLRRTAVVRLAIAGATVPQRDVHRAYTTRADLARTTSFLIMGLVGIIIASIVNVFLASSIVQLAISVVGFIVFVGLTAYDMQRITVCQSACRPS